MPEKTANELLYCSFCGRSNDEVNTLVAGDSAAICDRCIDRARDAVGVHRYERCATESKPSSDEETKA